MGSAIVRSGRPLTASSPRPVAAAHRPRPTSCQSAQQRSAAGPSPPPPQASLLPGGASRRAAGGLSRLPAPSARQGGARAEPAPAPDCGSDPSLRQPCYWSISDRRRAGVRAGGVVLRGCSESTPAPFCVSTTPTAPHSSSAAIAAARRRPRPEAAAGHRRSTAQRPPSSRNGGEILAARDARSRSQSRARP